MESTKKKLECRKCGMELHPDQKVCIRCGERTPRGGGFDYGDNKEPWRPSPKVLYTAGGVALLLLIVILVNALQVTPPEQVAQEWFDAVANRKVRVAENYVTDACNEELAGRFLDLRAVSDSLYEYIGDNSATWQVGKPKLNSAKKPTKATVIITMKSANGDMPIELQMVKVGRKWMVDKIIGSV